MEWLPYVFGGVIVVCVIVLAVTTTKMRAFRERVSQMSSALDQDVAQLREELDRERGKVAEAQEKVSQMIAEKTEASTKLVEAEKLQRSLLAEREEAVKQRDDAVNARVEAEKLAALRRQEVDESKKRMEDWETAKAQSVEAAKAAALTTTRELSSKLLEDHKRESQAAKKESKELVEKTTESLLKNLQGVTKSVATLDEQVNRNKSTVETVLRAISSPGGSGQFAQIGLENTLKDFGLVKDRDFFMDKQAEGTKLRPDAIVLLPDDTILVIDAKASKFLAELAEAEGSEEEEIAYKGLAATMNQHLKGLAGKNYKSEIVASYREAGRTGEIKRILSIMWLPNEAAIEKVGKADPKFVRKATKQQISVAGPSGLACLIGFARVQIDLGKQAESHKEIVDGTKALLDSIVKVVEFTGGIGKGLKAAVGSYVRLTGSMNTRLLPRVRALAHHGIKPDRHEGIPKSLPTYKVVELESGDLIDGEAEEILEPAILTDQSGNTV